MSGSPWAGRTLLVALVLLVYAPTLRFDFVRWDDPEHVAANPRVVESDGLWRSWRDTSPPGFYPITYATFYFEWRAAGGRPWLFHLDNALFHAGNALLVVELARQLGLAAGPSWLVAALWALHPVDVASVAWITERKNVLYVFLYLAALLLYLRAGRAWERSRLRAAGALALSLLVFAAALLSKAAAMTLPAALVLVDWARGRHLGLRFWLGLLPYVALALVAGLGLVSAVPVEMHQPDLAVRLAFAPRALWFYVRTFFWPIELIPVYPRWPLGTLGTDGVLGLAALAVLAVAVLVLRHAVPRALLFGAGFFLANVVPVAGIVWFTWYEHAFVSDHLAYLPNLGLAFVAVVALERLAAAVRLSPRIPALLLAGWCAALGIASWRQTAIWHDTQTLWHYTLARNPRCVLCYYNLGVMLEEGGDFAAAAEHYQRAVDHGPDPWALLNLANLRVIEGRVPEGVELYRRAVAIEPGNEKTHYNLGVVLVQLGRLDEAIAAFARAAAIVPDWAAAQHGLGEALLQAGRLREARAAFEAALAAAGDSPEAARTHRVLAAVLEQLERSDEALAHLRVAYRLGRDDADVVTALGAALLARERIEEGIAVLEDGVARLPDAAAIGALLAWVRATSSDPRWRDGAAAVRLAEHACALTEYRDADHLDTLAAAYAEAGRFDDAVATAERALAALGSESAEAEEMRGRLALYRARRPYRE